MTEHRTIVLAIDSGYCHSRAVRSLSARQRQAARVATAWGYLRLLPARGPFPRRYAVTSKGSYLLGTFDFDTLHQESRKRAA